MSTAETLDDPSRAGGDLTGPAYTNADEALQRFKSDPDAAGPTPEVDARIERVEVSRDTGVTFFLRDGRRVTTPLSWSWRLMLATDAELQSFEVGRYHVHWPDVDEDLSARGALRGTPAPRPGSRPGLREQREAQRETLAGRWTPGAIKKLRKARGESQAAFAEAMGVRQATVSDWENAKQEPSPMALRLLERTDRDVERGER